MNTILTSPSLSLSSLALLQSRICAPEKRASTYRDPLFSAAAGPMGQISSPRRPSQKSRFVILMTQNNYVTCIVRTYRHHPPPH